MVLFILVSIIYRRRYYLRWLFQDKTSITRLRRETVTHFELSLEEEVAGLRKVFLAGAAWKCWPTWAPHRPLSRFFSVGVFANLYDCAGIADCVRIFECFLSVERNLNKWFIPWVWRGKIVADWYANSKFILLWNSVRNSFNEKSLGNVFRVWVRKRELSTLRRKNANVRLRSESVS